MTLAEQWQISGSGPENYERFAVGRHMRPIAERFLEHIPLRAGDRVLDIACGTGIVARLAAAKIAPPGRIVGLDLNDGMLATAKRLADEAGLSIVWKQGDATALPFADAEFDVVLCQQGLQFISDKRRALREMRRVLSPGGMVGLNVFGKPSRFHAALADGLAKFLGDVTVATLSLAPFGLRNATILRALFDEAQFHDVSLESANITRRVEPTQEWLLQYSSGLPYSAAIAGMTPSVRAEMLREIATKLKDDWAGDSFVVPCEVHYVIAHA
ncbi:MAG: class I SAM-dependent methyltransferase [Burkholderiales bacterium]